MSKVRDDLRVTAEVIIDQIFDPNIDQRKCKSAFWVVKGDSQFGDVISQVSLAEALRVTGENKLKAWWSLPGFIDWFTNNQSFRQRAEYLADLAMDTIEEVLLNPETNPNARINAAKLMMEVAQKLPKQQAQVKLADQFIANMDITQLKEYVLKHTPKELLGAGKVVKDNGSSEQE
jgi:hypothetical protein